MVRETVKLGDSLNESAAREALDQASRLRGHCAGDHTGRTDVATPFIGNLNNEVMPVSPAKQPVLHSIIPADRASTARTCATASARLVATEAVSDFTILCIRASLGRS